LLLCNFLLWVWNLLVKSVGADDILNRLRFAAIRDFGEDFIFLILGLNIVTGGPCNGSNPPVEYLLLLLLIFCWWPRISLFNKLLFFWTSEFVLDNVVRLGLCLRERSFAICIIFLIPSLWREEDENIGATLAICLLSLGIFFFSPTEWLLLLLLRRKQKRKTGKNGHWGLYFSHTNRKQQHRTTHKSKKKYYYDYYYYYYYYYNYN